ncbi:hypothetical protein AAVH_36960, partial [Aphelenchoides avenae]
YLLHVPLQPHVPGARLRRDALPGDARVDEPASRVRVPLCLLPPPATLPRPRGRGAVSTSPARPPRTARDRLREARGGQVLPGGVRVGRVPPDERVPDARGRSEDSCKEVVAPQLAQ